MTRRCLSFAPRQDLFWKSLEKSEKAFAVRRRSSK
jgi:hypothetical protein